MTDGCLEALDELERYLDGECSAELAEVVSRHLADCGPCLSRSDFERSVRALLARNCRDQAPPGLLDRVLEQLR